LLRVAFFTLLERKILGFSQIRKGPNKVFLEGLIQPFADAVKLFLKKIIFPLNRNVYLYFISPVLSLFIVLWLWRLVPFNEKIFSVEFRALIFLIVLRINVYPLLFSGWSSNNKFSSLGSVRGVAQTISYEVRLFLLLMRVFMLSCSMNLDECFSLNKIFIIVSLILPLVFLWLITCIAERNRTPFDFSEGESELVSGFNTEYASVGFVIIFLSEYGAILLLCIISSLLLIRKSASRIQGLLILVLLGFLWVWLRATYPRYRYDKLLNFAWKKILPVTIWLLIFYFVIFLY